MRIVQASKLQNQDWKFLQENVHDIIVVWYYNLCNAIHGRVYGC